MTLTRKQYILLLITLCIMVCFLVIKNPSTVTAQSTTSTTQPSLAPVVITPSTPQKQYEYLEITEGCDTYAEMVCVSVHAGPGAEYEKIYELRKGMLLKIKSTELGNGQVWYQVYFDEWLRFPGRVEGNWYIPAIAGKVITAGGEELLTPSTPTTSKQIVIDLSDHMLYAYDGNVEFMRTKISTGIEATPTPAGTFTVYKKTPSRYMQGPLEGVTEIPFDLPGVPWNLYFTQDGAVIHGTYWHDRYGTDQSSGCINLPAELSKIIYDWAPLGTTVTIQK